MTIEMSSSLASQLSDLTVAAHGVGSKSEILNGNSDLRNLQMDSDKANPWKARQIAQSTDNKLLEADAWPEPSAPTERRAYNQKADEKPKNKKPARKWQNIEIEPPTFTHTRRGGGNRFSGSNGPNPSAYSSQPHAMASVRGRRGPTYLRGRISESPRGNGGGNGRPTNGFYPRQSERMPYTGRSGNDERINRSFNNEASVSLSVESSNSLDWREASKDNHVSDNYISNENSSSTNETATQADTTSMLVDNSVGQSDRIPVDSRSTPGVSNRRFLGNSVPDANASGRPGRYPDSTYPRSRRPPVRNHPFPYAGPHKGSQIVSQTVPIPAVPPVYLMPNVLPECMGNPLMNSTVTLNVNSISESGTAVLDTNSLQAVIMPTNAVSIVAATVDPPAVQFAPTSMQSPSTSDHQVDANIAIAPTQFSTEVVSLEQMLELITKVGWDKTKIPECLKDNPAVLASKQAALSETTNEDEEIEAEEEITDKQLSESGSTSGDRQSKSADVVIVDDKTFFVPRNVHHTKFLKLRSKYDYIRHHVEYYFSDANLHRDTHLQSILSNNRQACPLSSLLEFNRLRWINATESELLEAVLSSPAVNVIYSNNKAVGVAPSTAVSVMRHSNQFSPKAAILEVSNQHITETVIDPSQISIGIEESVKNAKTENDSNVITASDSSVSATDCIFEPMLFPVYASNQMASSSVLNIPFLMQQRLPMSGIGHNQLGPGHQFIPLTSAHGYLFPPPYATYQINPNQPQGISSLQFATQTPFCVGGPNNGNPGDASGVTAAQAVAAAVAAQQQQTTPYSNAQAVFMASQAPNIPSGNGQPSESATSPPLVPTFYRFATPQPPGLLPRSSFGQYINPNQQPGNNPGNQYYLQFLPTIQSNMQGCATPTYLPANIAVTGPNSAMAAAVAGRNLTPVNQVGGASANGGGYVLPILNFPQQSPNMPFPTTVTTSIAPSHFVQKYSAVSARPHQISSGGSNGNQRLVSSQQTQITTQTSVRPASSVSLDNNTSSRKSTPGVDIEIVETIPA